MTPSGELMNQQKVEEYTQSFWNEIIIICGHYEWIDQRIRDLYVDYEISIGEYVLSSGELSAMVFIDTFVRHIPWVLWNPESLEEESFSQKLGRQKEYPVNTRPKEFRWLQVPDVLTSGNHSEIEKWKKNNLH
jgi:tRNA (guanine37-N1)-methyltransferase